MNARQQRQAIAAAFFLSLFAFLQTGSAMPRVSRECCGTIQRIDEKRQSFVLQIEPERTVELQWKRSTRFVRDGRFISSDELKEGAPACIRYRSPFFGPKFVTKVTLNPRRVAK